MRSKGSNWSPTGHAPVTTTPPRQLVVLVVCGAAMIVSADALRPRAIGPRLSPAMVDAADSEELDPGDTQGCGGRSKKTLTDSGSAKINFARTSRPSPTFARSIRHRRGPRVREQRPSSAPTG